MSLIQQLNRQESYKTKPRVKCVRCEGSGKQMLPSVNDWMTYTLTDCPKCGGRGEMIREWG